MSGEEKRSTASERGTRRGRAEKCLRGAGLSEGRGFPPSVASHTRTPEINSREVKKVLSVGRRLDGRTLRAFVLFGEGEGLRTAFIVGKRNGTAVARNRTRRLLREAFRMASPTESKDADIAIIPKAGFGQKDLASIRDEIAALLNNAGLC